MADVLQVTDDTFEEEIIKSDIPAMVDFWAEWCGPCKMVSPVVEELAKEYEGKIKIASMDVDGGCGRESSNSREIRDQEHPDTHSL